MNKKLYIPQQEVTDWMEEALRKEILIKTDEDAVEAIRSGRSTSEVARASVVSMLLGEAPPDLLRPIKVLVQVGAMVDVMGKVKKEKRKVNTRSGDYDVQTMVGHVSSKEDGKGEDEVVEPQEDDSEYVSYVDIHDPLAVEWTENYLYERIPAQVWVRLLILKENGVDIRNAADMLIKKINEMVEKIG